MKPSESKKAQANAKSVKVWGLTGGIASGKSTVARIFAEAGVPVVDADQVARDLRAPGGAAHDPIVARFGTVDPARLREIVFSDPVARAELEAILHPLIRTESMRRIEAAVTGQLASATNGSGRRMDNLTAPPAVPVIYEAALLVETGRYRDFAGLIVVSADEKLRVKRLMDRDQNDEELAQRIVAAQISDEKRRSCADFVIENHGSLEDLRKQVLAIVPKLV